MAKPNKKIKCEKCKKCGKIKIKGQKGGNPAALAKLGLKYGMKYGPQAMQMIQNNPNLVNNIKNQGQQMMQGQMPMPPEYYPQQYQPQFYPQEYDEQYYDDYGYY